MSEQAIRLPGPDSDVLPVAVVFLDRDLRKLHANDAWRRLQLEDDRREGSPWISIWEPQDQAHLRDTLREAFEEGKGRTLAVRGHRPEQWIELRVAPVQNGDANEVAVVALDISAHKQREAMLAFDAVRDQLTGLSNRVALSQHLSGALGRLKRQPSILAVLFIDLDGFRDVNQEHGHIAGDRVLLIAAQQLRMAIRPADLLARVGGDEFVAVCESLGSAEEALTIANRLAGSLEEPIEVSATDHVELSATIGVAFAEGPEEDVTVLLARADMAMYSAKQQGPGRVHFPAPTALSSYLTPIREPRDHLGDVAERLSLVGGDLAEGWANSLMHNDAGESQRWRSACHYADLALTALRGGEKAPGGSPKNGSGE